MGLEKIIENIQKEGQEKVNNILHDAELQAAKILQEKQKAINELAIKKRQELDRYIDLLKKQEESSVEIEVKKIRLNAEKDILNQTYQECLTALSNLPHEMILTSLLNKTVQELPEAAFVYSNKRDEPTVRSLTKIPYGGSIDVLGGVIIENKEKNLKLDYRYETIAELVWEQFLKEIAKQLFS